MRRLTLPAMLTLAACNATEVTYSGYDMDPVKARVNDFLAREPSI